MKKFYASTLLFVLSLILVMPSRAHADYPAPGGPFSNYFYIQNQTASSITCVYTIYESNSLIKYNSAKLNISARQSLFIDVHNLGLEIGIYTAVANCSGKAAIVTNFGDYNSGAGYLGWSGNTTWYLPGLYDDYYDYYSTVIFQNATGDVIDVTLEIYQPNDSNPILTLSYLGVSAYDHGYFELEGQEQLSTDQTYSGKITSTGKVIPIVNIYGRGSVDGQLYTYKGFSGGAKTMYAPVVMKNYYEYNTSLNIQNIGTGATTVTVTYSNGYSQSNTIQAKAAWSIYVPTQTPGLPTGLFGAKITSTSYSVVVLVNESNGYNRAASYTGTTSGYGEIYAPVLDKRYNYFNSSVTCQMIANGPNSINIEYYTAGNPTPINTETSPAINNNQIFTFYQPNNSYIPNGWHGSARIYSSGRIACIINQDRNEPPDSTTIWDKLYAHEGVP